MLKSFQSLIKRNNLKLLVTASTATTIGVTVLARYGMHSVQNEHADRGNKRSLAWPITEPSRYSHALNNTGIDTLDQDGSTPVHTAAAMGDVEAIVAYKAAGGDVNRRNRERNTPIFIAAEHHSPAIVTQFHSHPCTSPSIVLKEEHDAALKIR